jgi:hypothetical protein
VKLLDSENCKSIEKTVAEIIKSNRLSLKKTDLVSMVNSSRKKIVPVLEYLDSIDFSRREGDLRIINKNKCKEVV